MCRLMIIQPPAAAAVAVVLVVVAAGSVAVVTLMVALQSVECMVVALVRGQNTVKEPRAVEAFQILACGVSLVQLNQQSHHVAPCCRSIFRL